MNSRITQPDCTTTSVILDNEANNSPPDTCDESDEMAEVIEMDFRFQSIILTSQVCKIRKTRCILLIQFDCDFNV